MIKDRKQLVKVQIRFNSGPLTTAVTGEAHTVGLGYSMLCVLCTTVRDEAELCRGSQLSFLAGVVYKTILIPC